MVGLETILGKGVLSSSCERRHLLVSQYMRPTTFRAVSHSDGTQISAQRSA